MFWTIVLLFVLLQIGSVFLFLWISIRLLKFKDVQWKAILTTGLVYSSSGLTILIYYVGIKYYLNLSSPGSELVACLISLILFTVMVVLLAYQLETKIRWAISALFMTWFFCSVSNAILLIPFRFYVAEAYVMPTNSMAPTVLGYHGVLVFSEEENRKILIPTRDPRNNQYSKETKIDHPIDNITASFKLPEGMISGDRFLVSKLKKDLSRWDILAIRNPSDDIVLKRLIGLPGDHIELKSGEVEINGEWAQKPDSMINDLWFPVDIRLNLPPELVYAPNLMTPTIDSQWTVNDSLWHVDATKNEKKIEFEGRVCDYWFFNQWNSPHEKRFFPVEDLRISFQIEEFQGDGKFDIHLNYYDQQIQWRISLGEDLELFVNRRVTDGNNDQFENLIHESFAPIKLSPGGKFTVIARDGTAKFFLDDALAAEHQILSNIPEVLASKNEALINTTKLNNKKYFSFRAHNLDMAIGNLSVSRDIYYRSLQEMDSNPFGLPSQWQLNVDEIFLLGDNSSRSYDSRSWDSQSSISDIVGKLKFIYWPAPRAKSF